MTATMVSADGAAAAAGVVWSYLTLDVRLEDGRCWLGVECDHRDLRVAQLRYKVDADADAIGFAMGAAHACLTRTGELTDTWPDFQRYCTHAQPSETPTPVDPTGTAPAG